MTNRFIARSPPSQSLYGLSPARHLQGYRSPDKLIDGDRLFEAVDMLVMGHGLKVVFVGTRGNIGPKNRRHRMHASALISNGRHYVMIDCGETWREHIFRVNPGAIVLTHAHPDHAFGLDAGSPCPVWVVALAKP